MGATGTRQAIANNNLSEAALQPDVNVRQSDSISGRQICYGLPCANCHAYYDADQSVCPVCKSNQRVSPATAPAPTVQTAEPVPSLDDLEEEREGFLKQFRSELFSANMQINAAASFRCSLEENHEGSAEPAAICKGCYESLEQQADQMEAAMHIDVREAAQIIYDAVWADPSDPAKTYQNAASALLTEIRKRAGMDIVLTTLQPYTH
ncbi:MAG TPA: hypothetical protein VJX16_28030 [Terriglobales bacterium]|nr:hypothetical protein [Terriglobales bacterium]